MLLKIMDHRSTAEKIFRAGVQSVLPRILIQRSVSLSGNILSLGHLDYDIKKIDRIFVIGAGKASGLMASEVEKILGKRISGGIIIVKDGHACKLKHMRIKEAGHPTPDSRGFKATKKILKIAKTADVNDLVICLISGGGSALMADLPNGIKKREIALANNLLVNSGASIMEINAVRKHLSQVKGGHLARHVYPANLVSLILSDVPGDDLDVIASGPTTADSTTFEMALSVMRKYKSLSSIPEPIFRYLKDGEAGKNSETPKKGDDTFKKTHNILIGNNKVALEAAKLEALELNINAVIIDYQLQGNTSSVAEYIVETALRFKADMNEVKPVCLLFGGETTLKMTGKGRGGRNQHLALLCVEMLRDLPGITILSAGTDGTDGPTDAAGAVVDYETCKISDLKKADPLKYIDKFDSYRFFKKVGGHVFTGPTMTNVMDMIVVIVS